MKPLWDWNSRESRKIRIIKLFKFNFEKKGGGQKRKAFDFLVNFFK